MATNGHLDLDEGVPVDQRLCGPMIGSLLYFTASRLDIMFSVCLCAGFHASPKECHLSTVKRILRYLKHTSNIGLWYPKGAQFELIRYLDSDYARCKVDRKSTSGTCQMRSNGSHIFPYEMVLPIAIQTMNFSYILGHCMVLYSFNESIHFGVEIWLPP
jgi:hypothetical protein